MKIFKQIFGIGKHISVSTKMLPYYCKEQLRMMTDNDIINRLNELNDEMEELKKELSKRSKSKI